MLDYRQLHAFATVLEAQSFDKAARRLHLTQSAVSQRVKQLEEHLGQALIVRSQPLRPTPAGQQLLRHYRQINLLQEELREALGDGERQGFTRLAIGLNADSLATWFLDALSPMLDSERMLLELLVDDQDQTHHFLRQGEVIGCISASAQPMQGCSCTPLGSMDYRALATPAFRRRYFAEGVCEATIRQAPAVEFNHKDELQDRYLQQFWGITSGEYPRHRVPSPQAFMAVIRRGLGWGMLPDLQSQDLLQEGTLEELHPQQVLPVPLYWHTWNLASDASRRLTECLSAYCRERLSPLEKG